LHEIQTAENCQTHKRGRNEIITVGAPSKHDFVKIISNLIAHLCFRVK